MRVRHAAVDTNKATTPAPRWTDLAALAVVVMLAQSSFFLTSAALPLYLRDLGAPQNRVGFDVGLGNLAGTCVTLVLGPALNRLGPRAFLIIGAGTYLLSAAGMLILPHESTVTALRIAQGIGTAMMLPSAYTMVARLVPGRTATALGLMGGLSNIALAIGPPVGLTLYTQHGAHGLFLPSIGAAALALVATLLLRPMERPAERPRGFGFNRIWLPNLLANSLGAVYWGGVATYLPIVMRHVHGPNAGFFFTADALGVLLLRLPTGMLADRSGALLPKVLGILITLPGIAVLAVAPSVFTLAIAGACTGIGAGLFITGITAELSDLSTAANRGTAMALSSAAFSGGVFLGASSAGLLIGPEGFDGVLVLGLAATALALPLTMIRVARQGAPASPEP